MKHFNCIGGYIDMLEDLKVKIEAISKTLTEETALLSLSEECSEFSQAALKLIRAEHLTENWTPVSVEEAKTNLEEEFYDVVTCAAVCGFILEEDDLKDILLYKQYASGNRLQRLISLAHRSNELANKALDKREAVSYGVKRDVLDSKDFGISMLLKSVLIAAQAVDLTFDFGTFISNPKWERWQHRLEAQHD